jgi:hypothetical protein
LSFLYLSVLEIEPGLIEGVIRAKRPALAGRVIAMRSAACSAN